MTTHDNPIILSEDADLDDAVSAFKDGGIIAYPTETFYGLGVDPFNPAAVKKLFDLKGRSESNPVSIIVHELNVLPPLVTDVPRYAEALMERFWPGPLTMVFKAGKNVMPELVAGTGKIGIRVPSSPIARRLARALMSPITATSANPSGEKPPVSAKEVYDYFGTSIDVLIDGGTLGGIRGSTVVDVSGEKIALIRDGEVPFDRIVDAIEDTIGHRLR